MEDIEALVAIEAPANTLTASLGRSFLRVSSSSSRSGTGTR